ncbi:MAG: nucleoside triphosphate pyrophosphatase [Sphingomicrobium sp.]
MILASASAIRAHLLDAAGVSFTAVPANIDEAAAKARHHDPAELARELAEAKAVAVSAQQPGEWVIGSDSVAQSGGRLFDKPAGRAEAAGHLALFSGRPLTLTSAVALVRDGRVDWTCVDTATLHVRPLSADFIDAYLDAEWPAVAGCVGVFRMEGRGVTLFSAIDGSHFTILGLPLLPLLGALRERNVLPS